METNPTDSLGLLTDLAGIHLPDDRRPAVAAGLEGTRRIAAALNKRDYGAAEPAGRFRAPQSEPR